MKIYNIVNKIIEKCLLRYSTCIIDQLEDSEENEIIYINKILFCGITIINNE